MNVRRQQRFVWLFAACGLLAPLLLNGCGGDQQSASTDGTGNDQQVAPAPPAPPPATSQGTASAPAPATSRGSAGAAGSTSSLPAPSTGNPSATGQVPAPDTTTRPGRDMAQQPPRKPAAPGFKFELDHEPQLGFAVGDLAPEIFGEDLDGEPFRLSDYRGKVVVLDFWGNW